MRSLVGIAALFLTACPGSSSDGGEDDGNGNTNVDAGTPSTDAPSQSVDAATVACPMPSAMPDAGMLVAFKAQRCNVPNTGGTRKWYRLSAQLASSGDWVQIELWPNTGAYTGAVTTGSFPIAGADAAYDTCGACARGLGDKAQPTQKEYLATAGTIDVTAVGGPGQPLTASLTNASFVEVDATTKAPVTSGCGATLAALQISGTVVDGGGGGGGGGGCPSGVGD